MRVARACMVAALAVPPLAAAAEDLTIVFTHTNKGKRSTSTQYFTGSKFRTSDGESDTIVDGAAGRMTVLQHKDKKYWETSFDEMKQAMERMTAQFRQMQEQMKANPMAEKLMGNMFGAAGGAIKVEKGPSPRKIAGYDCDHYVVSMGETMRTELWTTTKLVPPAQMYEARKAAASFGPQAQQFGSFFDKLKEVKGFTLADKTSARLGPIKGDSASEATVVKKGAVPADAFKVPVDYKKMDSPFAKMLKGKSSSN